MVNLCSNGDQVVVNTVGQTVVKRYSRIGQTGGQTVANTVVNSGQTVIKVVKLWSSSGQTRSPRRNGGQTESNISLPQALSFSRGW